MANPTPDIEKIFINAEDLLQDSFELALRIHESDFCPSFILGVWHAGLPDQSFRDPHGQLWGTHDKFRQG